MKLGTDKPASWSANEVKIMRDKYPTTTAREIAELIGRPTTAVLKKAQQLGLQKIQRRQPGRYRPWEASDDELLKSSFCTMTIIQIASQLGRSNSAIQMRVHYLGLTGLKSRVMPLGTERIRNGRPERKVANTGVRKLDWKRIDVLEWEAINGPVPHGMLLLKQSGKPRTVENLQLASPGEVPMLAVRHNSPPEMRRLLDLKSQLGFALSRIEKLNPQADQSKEPNGNETCQA